MAKTYKCREKKGIIRVGHGNSLGMQSINNNLHSEYIKRIVIDKDLDWALVYYSDLVPYDEILFRKIDGKWVFYAFTKLPNVDGDFVITEYKSGAY
jgi:hypothetical protein